MAEIRTYIEARRYGHLRGKRYYDEKEKGSYEKALNALKNKYPNCDYLDCIRRSKVNHVEWWANLRCGLGIEIANDFFKKTLSQITTDDMKYLYDRRELIKKHYLIENAQ